MVVLERNLRETRRQTQEKKPALGQDLSNLTLELQSQEGRLVAVQAQHNELLLGLKGLKESLNIQALRLTQVEGGGNVTGTVRQGEEEGDRPAVRGPVPLPGRPKIPRQPVPRKDATSG